ncbi:polysaccharide biosynthesis/export family protein [Robertkochia sediminum]|uniref:polysaccharide biosynthesis/export family protein n=1 Tax=Robertkochia sediminum TaxID=2785326 RepID=UPI0019323E7B|nr:polysaccharide biosynthesis/export family protein [Robertkochia sediminum]MBL7474037.1 polysaccharide biosynthesis/export family protein [Robertkochia sediminum]
MTYLPFFLKKILTRLFLLFLLFQITSCASRKDVAYFQNAGAYETMVETRDFEPRLKVDDLLSIYISANNIESTTAFNLKKGEGISYEEVDYIIDKEGFIDFPVLGKIKLMGLTTEEAKKLIESQLIGKKLLRDPVVNLRIKNFRVTILGHVKKPGTYSVPTERITLLEALGLAGDLEMKARRDNVLVIRDFDGVKTFTRINLTTKEFIKSPVYYLTQNDVVYVEPNESAIKTTSLDNRATIMVSIFSVLITSTALILTRN